ncbi:MAG: Serine/threonine-protein kinase [Alyxoria varia]|nr:MAG: Serine/threonine-protein kinase [Alyxoria varia]
MPERGSLIAIKTVQHSSLKGKIKENLFSEIRIMQEIAHPHIVALIDIKESANHIHLVMEYCGFGDLSHFVKKRDKLSAHPITAELLQNYPNPAAGNGFNEVIVRHFAKQLAAALQFLRSQNLIHRDLKPQNLLLDPSPTIISRLAIEDRPYAVSKSSLSPIAGLDSAPLLKIADFGFARHLPTTTMAETLCGSPLYMAPEILAYEKYDAKADLWSVGAVLYELIVGRPPFRAHNHFELLRKIQQANDNIRFAPEIKVSDDMKNAIRALLKHRPTERISWDGFFNGPVIVDDIPGLIESDRKQSKRSATSTMEKPAMERKRSGLDEAPEPRKSGESSRPSSRPTPRSSFDRQRSYGGGEPSTSTQRQQRRRPSLVSHPTAPAGQAAKDDKTPALPANDKRQGKAASPPVQSSPRDGIIERERPSQKNQDRLAREARERAAQDVAFERDYVMVDPRAVQVNAFADELAASPQVQREVPASHPNAMVRRATTQGNPSSTAPTTTGAQGGNNQGKQMQVALRPDSHQRKTSYERRYGTNRSSATSALAKALDMVNFRLYGSPFNPLSKSPPTPHKGYGPFPAFPSNPDHGPLMIGDTAKPVKMDEDHRVLSTMEDSATRSDVVYSFAEVKYKQLIPIAPSNENGLGIRRPGGRASEEDGVDDDDNDEDLTVDAVISISEEALVLYVKTLAILTNTINFAGSWWTRKSRGEVLGEIPSSSAPSSTTPRSLDSGKANLAAVSSRINNVVQWARNRFNECLEKTEYVSRRLQDAQKEPPTQHSGNPRSRPSSQTRGKQATSHATSSNDHISLTTGVTAEKLMYDRALEMNQGAAVNELVGQDLPGSEVSYLTAVRLLEAVLEREGEILDLAAVAKEAEKEKDGVTKKDDAGTKTEKKKSAQSSTPRSSSRRDRNRSKNREAGGDDGGDNEAAAAKSSSKRKDASRSRDAVRKSGDDDAAGGSGEIEEADRKTVLKLIETSRARLYACRKKLAHLRDQQPAQQTQTPPSQRQTQPQPSSSAPSNATTVPPTTTSTNAKAAAQAQATAPTKTTINTAAPQPSTPPAAISTTSQQTQTQTQTQTQQTKQRTRSYSGIPSTAPKAPSPLSGSPRIPGDGDSAGEGEEEEEVRVEDGEKGRGEERHKRGR